VENVINRHCTFNNLLSSRKKNTYKKAIIPALIITISMVTTLLVALALVDDTISSISASAQDINATASNETSKSSEEATKFYDQGHAFLEQKKFNEAIANYDKALAITPNNTKALGEKGDALLGLKKFNESIVYYDKALAIKPNITGVL
jgi:tetratricopeptide (TPR) repeat protein